MIVAVSDIHLGLDQKYFREQHFKNFLIYLRDNLFEDGGDLVLLGDIFDFWRRDLCDVLIQSEDITEKLLELNTKNVNIHYVIGNHDYRLRSIAKEVDMPFKTIGKNLVLFDKSTSTKFMFMHGYQLEVMANPYIKDLELYEKLAEILCNTSGFTAHLAFQIETYIFPQYWNCKKSILTPPKTRLSDKHNIKEKMEILATSKARPLYLGVDANDWFVFGHTHYPFLDDNSRTINTGSWIDETENEYPYLNIHNGIPELDAF